jgi:uncharacterized protein with gpF-like domain
MIKQGNALLPSVTIEAAYRRDIRVIILAMHKAVVELMKEGFRQEPEFGHAMDAQIPVSFQYKSKDLQNRFDKILERAGRLAAIRFLDKQTKYAARSFIRSIRPLVESKEATLMLKGSVIEPVNAVYAEKVIAENVALIRSIGSRYFDRIQKQVVSSLSKGGGGQKQVFDDLMKIKGVSERQAKLIARDQNAKVHGQLTVERMKAGGITKARWLHSSAGKVPREYHKTKWDGHSEPPNGLDGYIFDITQPPVADTKTGERAFPSGLINCRCVAIPVIEI